MRSKTMYRLRSLLIIIFICLYIPSFLHWVTGQDISTDTIRIGVIEDSINVEACLFRTERVLISPFNGTIAPYVTEGERIAANGKIAVVIGDSSKKLLDQLAALNLKLLGALKQKGDNKEFFSGDLLKLDQSIAGKVKNLAVMVNSGNLTGTGQIKTDIDGLMAKRAEISGDYGNGDTYIADLKKEKERINSKIAAETKDIRSDTAGFVSFTIDGFEEKLPPEYICKADPDDIDVIFRSAKTGNSMAKEKNSLIAGQPYAKLIEGYQTFLVFITGPENLNYLSEGDKIRQVRINDIGVVTQGTINHISDIKGHRRTVSIAINRYSGELSNLRFVNADIIKNRHEGLKVPLKSLIRNTGKESEASIMLVRNSAAVLKGVEIISCTDKWAIIKGSNGNAATGNVALYDTYIINPKNIKEGQVVE